MYIAVLWWFNYPGLVFTNLDHWAVLVAQWVRVTVMKVRIMGLNLMQEN